MAWRAMKDFAKSFDDSSWAAPQIIGPHPSGVFSELSAQEPRLRFTAVPPVSLTTLGDGAVVADFGNVMPARPIVRFASGSAGRVLNIQAGYRLTSDGHVSSTPETDVSGLVVIGPVPNG